MPFLYRAERSILRMYFQSRQLAQSVAFPKRKREDIKRSRRPAKCDQHTNLYNWQHLINFCLTCGLRREQLREVLAIG